MKNKYVPEIYAGEKGNWFVNGYNTGTRAQRGGALDAGQGKILQNEINGINGNLEGVNNSLTTLFSKYVGFSNGSYWHVRKL